MRIFFLLAPFASVLMISNPAMAQSETWQFFEDKDPVTNEVVLVYTAAFPEQAPPIDRYVTVGCMAQEGELTIRATFGAATDSSSKPTRIEWLIDQGEVMEFPLLLANDERYVVYPPRSIVLARMLVNAKLFITTNGFVDYMQFKSLAGGENVERVLKACGL